MSEELRIFENYKRTVFRVRDDIEFWSNFLNWAIKQYPKTFPQQIDRVIRHGLFTTIDIDFVNKKAIGVNQPNPEKRNSNSLEQYKFAFFEWVLSYATLRIYNSLEILLLKSIQLRFFKIFYGEDESRKNTETARKIKQFLNQKNIKNVTKNNRHIIAFLKEKSPSFKQLIKLKVREDLKVNWEEFFEMTSILRNVIVHGNADLTNNTVNELKKNGGTLLNQYFDISMGNYGLKKLSPVQAPERGNYNNFLKMFDDFAVNSMKAIFEKGDLTFLGFEKPGTYS